MGNTHCQICGRAIKTVKAASGVDCIAHHGYTRKHGWQTASCFGARWRPYELACDALPPAIESIERFIQRQEEQLRAMLVDPPARLTYTVGYRHTPGVVERPADGYSPDQRPDYRPHSYDTEYRRLRYTIERNIKGATEDAKVMRGRLAAWVRPSSLAVG